MTTTEITVRAHKRKKPAKQPDPFEPIINARLAERQQRVAAGQVNEFRNKIGFLSWLKRKRDEMTRALGGNV
ncbi:MULTISPECIES: hypothetical protein [unclassified Rhizobium]|uniref:hypothetical protein n=1 Tax=unclassified Rhizobium TaxID=2613769 RepID=UPI00288C12BA|nr:MULTISPECIES: hypothetical protein [unclassified Rhizobium]